MNIQSTTAWAIVQNAKHMTGAEKIAEKASTHRNITEERAIYTMVDRSQVHVGYERSPSGRLSVKSVEAFAGE